MADKSEIVCITVLYNPDSDVVENIKKYNGLVGRIILVDNSNDNNEKMFNDLEGIEYIPLMGNEGIARAINIGIEKSDEKYVLTMDQDSTISENLINAYLRFLNNSDKEYVAALTPKYDTDRHHVKKGEGTKKVLLSMQSGTLFKRSTFEEIGLFDEELFLDVVDWEYFLRINKAGLQTLQVNDAILIHRPAITKIANLGFFKLKYGTASPLRYYYQGRNLLYTGEKYNNHKMYVTLAVKWLKIVLLFDNKKEYLKLFKQGIRDAKSGKLGKYEIGNN
ncbi:glycosyltransferase [Lactobacillus delbrueckii subsp. bulgaricus]|uniref:glycosyltransferase n=1 Tax=Lactobacillus delbrueckii TaxID=1584 RepID=UPI00155E5BBF|nr:glycosyltransferase [Lactobacillus delbrueckii]NRD06417.1 glycosyltransferase [Lactobacillus delbrueckii subsp. bulgaricus]